MYLMQLLTIYAIGHINAIDAFNTNDQVGADVDYGSFENPSNYVRPRFRYWVPDASVDPVVVGSDIVSAASRGIGGVEFLGYYLYGGGEAGDIPTDWTTYGWGTIAWKRLFDAALETTQNNGLLLDFPLGPNQGAGVPAPADAEGLLVELLPYNVSVPLGGTYDGLLPGWGSGDLVSASSGLVLETINVTLIDDAEFSHRPTPGNKSTLTAESLLDLTSSVTSDGRLVYTFPSTDEGMEYRLFAYYQVRSTYREQPSPEDLGFPSVPQSPVNSYVENGSRVVDHFSAQGALVVTDFWEQHLLSNGTQELLQAVGNYGWEDSREIGAGVTVWWTPSLLQRFVAARGYSLSALLPLIFYRNNGVNGALPSRTWYVTDEPDEGTSHIEDYRQTLTELNQDYIKALAAWCQDTLHAQFSAQVGYNLQMDMLAQIPYVNAPETESLDFNHQVDAFRQYSGPANLANKRVVSSELGAERQQAYQETISTILWNVKRSIAGGINQFVFHGLTYSGSYPGCTWPGFTTFAFRFSEMHGPQQPGWDYYSDFLNWTARTQWVAQTGGPIFDLAFWLKNDNWTSVVSEYTESDLNAAGFTYQYLSPDNFDLPAVAVSDGLLVPDKQAFKALVIRANDSLTVSGVDHLVDFAQAGLPIIFSGGLPTRVYGNNATANQSFNTSLTSIQDLANVHIVPYEDLADTLLQLDITPRIAPSGTAFSGNNTLYTNRRFDLGSQTTYATIYNDATGLAPATGIYHGNVTFEDVEQPYIYNAYEGTVSPLLIFDQDDTRTTLSLSLAGNQSTIVAFHHDENPADHFTSTSSNILSVSKDYPDNDTAIVTLTPSDDPNLSHTVTTSNGSLATLAPPTASSISLTNWSLTLESWAPPQDINNIESIRTNSTYTLTELLPWSEIDSPRNENVSGRGYYSTSFDVPTDFRLGLAGEDITGGVLLELPPYTHTLRASVNGKQVPPLDIDAPVVDITAYLNPPDVDDTSTANVLDVIVSTPLGNAARAVWGELRCGGLDAQGNVPPVAAYGLVGSARIVPLSMQRVRL